MAYEKLAGPLGAERDDIRHALLMALTHNLWAKRSKKPDEFLPVWNRTPQTPEQQQRILQALWGRRDEEV
jgi:hypothetical protein